MNPAPNLCRRDQIRFHWRCIVTHLRRSWRHLRDAAWSVPGLVRAILDL